jgi:hypothetical protein
VCFVDLLMQKSCPTEPCALLQASLPASLLVRVLGVTPNHTPNVATPNTKTQFFLDVSVRYSGGRIRRKRREVRPLAAAFSELPIDELVELQVPDREADVNFRLFQVTMRTNDANPAKKAGKSAENEAPQTPKGRRTELGSASVAFSEVLAARAMQRELPLETGTGCISIVMVLTLALNNPPFCRKAMTVSETEIFIILRSSACPV